MRWSELRQSPLLVDLGISTLRHLLPASQGAWRHGGMVQLMRLGPSQMTQVAR